VAAGQLDPVPFEQLGFRALGTMPYPTYTKQFLYSVPVVLTLLPPLLLAVSRARRETSMSGAPGSQEEP
jgi:hypothetical protein